MNLKELILNFIQRSKVQEVNLFGNGHIHHTYRVKLEDETQEFILQKINTSVFPNYKFCIQNHLLLQESFKSKFIEIPHLIKTKKNQYYFEDEEKNIWRMMNFIRDSYSIELVENENQAYEAGRGYGLFLKECSHLNPQNYKEAIKDFNRISFRIQQLNDAIKKDRVSRYKEIKNLVEFYKQREPFLLELEKLMDSRELPLRLVHNDTKINNLLFRNEKSIAVIDLDTIAPGSLLFDYGDALRTICNSCAEDEKEISKVTFNLSFFQSFTKGFLKQVKPILNSQEKEYLYAGPIYMTFIMGIRFLADYINGDIYYKTEYAEHNLVRSKVQKKLIEQIELNMDILKEMIKSD